MARTEEELRALIEQDHQLQELTRHPGWAILVDFLETAMRGDKRSVLNGDVENHDVYLKRTWFFRGAHYALDAPKMVNEIAANARKQGD